MRICMLIAIAQSSHILTYCLQKSNVKSCLEGTYKSSAKALEECYCKVYPKALVTVRVGSLHVSAKGSCDDSERVLLYYVMYCDDVVVANLVCGGQLNWSVMKTLLPLKYI